MLKSNFLKILGSLPVILLALYFSKILGIVLIVIRCISYKNKKLLTTSIELLIISLILFLPRILEIFKNSNLINEIIASNFYIKLAGFSKSMLIISMVLLFIACILTYILNRFQKSNSSLSQKVKNYVNDINNLQTGELNKTGVVVKCRNCGANNVINKKTAKCKFCKSIIEKK